MNPRGTPQRIRRGQLLDQRADIVRHCWAAGTMSALLPPEQSKAAPMPCEDSRRLHDKERRAPCAPSVRQPHPQHAVNGRQAKAWTAGAIREGQLMPQREDLQMQRRA